VLKIFKKIFCLLLVIVSTISLSTTVYAATTQVKGQANMSTWLWNTKEIVTKPDEIINFLVNNKVNVLYLQINYDVNINDYKKFIKKALSQNISVQALNGSPNWISDGDTSEKTFFNWISNYQKKATSAESFKGVHIDVEPYLNSEYNINQTKVIERYQDCLSLAIKTSKSLKITLSVDIPFWFNEIQYHNKYGNGVLAEWIIKNINQIVIMAYRDSAIGENGIIKIVNNNMKIAEKYNTKLIIAVEAGESNEGNNITFFEEGQKYMMDELKKVSDYYKSNKNFGGFAIHYVDSWMNMKL
jgi:hypothetical protein